MRSTGGTERDKVGDRRTFFLYEYNGRIAVRKPILAQKVLKELLRMFDRVGLQINLGKTKAIICTPGFTLSQKDEVAYKHMDTGEGSTFRYRNKTRASCEYCRATMVVLLLRKNTERTHGKIMTQTCGVDIIVGGEETYLVSLPCVLTLVECLVEGCPERAHNQGRLHKHFMYRHWKAKIYKILEGPPPLPWCNYWGMNIPAYRL